MSQASVFGVSWWDPLGSFAEGQMANHFGKKSAKQALQQQIYAAKNQALKMPSWQKAGLIKAGYNPLLALGSVGSQQLPSAYSGWMPSVGSGAVTGYDHEKFVNSRAAKSLKNAEVTSAKSGATISEQQAVQSELETEILRMERDAQASETHARAAQAFVDEIEAEATSKAITGVLPEIYVNGQPTYKTSAMQSRQFDRLVEKLENQIDRDAFRNSKEHAMYEDTINAIHGFNDMGSAYEHWRSGRRNYQRFNRFKNR